MQNLKENENKNKPLDKVEYGIFEGEECLRDGCLGIIETTPKEGWCSCFQSAPCSYCTQQNEYCPECGWKAENA